MADDELRVSSKGNGRVIQWHKDGRIIDTWAMHLDPTPSDALCRRMAEEIINRPWLKPVPYLQDMEDTINAYLHNTTLPDSVADQVTVGVMKIVRGED